MEMNRNQFFFAGLLILLLGIQFRVVNSYVLKGEVSRFLHEQTQSAPMAASPTLFGSAPAALVPNKVLNPPDWLGWCLMSVGSVLILHSLAMKKPGG